MTCLMKFGSLPQRPPVFPSTSPRSALRRTRPARPAITRALRFARISRNSAANAFASEKTLSAGIATAFAAITHLSASEPRRPWQARAATMFERPPSLVLRRDSSGRPFMQMASLTNHLSEQRTRRSLRQLVNWPVRVAHALGGSPQSKELVIIKHAAACFFFANDRLWPECGKW
jgi:hypothetical protein